MSILENLTDKVTKTAKAAAKKSGEFVEIAKLSLNISIEEEKINSAYTELGKVVYESYKDTNNEIYKEYCERIKQYQDNIKEMKQKILELKSLKICKECQREIDIDFLYCSKCGTKQDIYEESNEKSEEIILPKTCASCKTEVEQDACYCPKCGTRL